MKLTKPDIQLFKSLKDSETGTLLLDYLDRLVTDISDIRRIKDEDVATMRRVVDVLDFELISRIKLVNKKQSNEFNEYE